MNWLWVSMWALLGWLLGILLYFIGGFAVHLLPGDRDHLVNRVADHYSGTAMKLVERAVLVERGTKWDIFRTSHDAEKNADTFSLDGEPAHITNETGLLSTLHGKAFGLCAPPEDDVAVYTSPEVGELGRIEAERTEKGELRDGNGEYEPNVTLSPGRPLVQLREYADRMIPGSRSLHDLDETIELYKQSQRMFGESKTTQFMILIIAYSAAMLVSWMIITNGGGTVPSGGVPVPPMGGG